MKSVSKPSKTLPEHRAAEQAILGMWQGYPRNNRLRQALQSLRMIMLSIIVLGNACYEGPPQYEETGFVTCREDTVWQPNWVWGEGLVRKLWSIVRRLMI
jgi:hypothetical protein